MKELDPRIKIRAPLRCDGIGRLDCAEDVESGGRLAVRWLPLDANGDAAAQACAKLPEHPTLPRIRHTGQVGGSAYVAMDFPEGQLLSVVLGEERLEADAVIRMGGQLADALATVHEQGVVHGELGSESVLMVPPDKAYLFDMPLVIANRLTDRRGENRLMHNLVRIAPFLAPERARGEGASRAGDVYSLGSLLCVAAGAPMPQAATTLGVVHCIAQGEWQPRVPSSIPQPFASLLTRMVALDPAARPTAREVAQAFGEVPNATALPTVPEMPLVRLPPELMAVADALVRRPSGEVTKLPAPETVKVGHTEMSPEVAEEVFKRPTVEMPLVAPAALAAPVKAAGAENAAGDGEASFADVLATADTVRRSAVPVAPVAAAQLEDGEALPAGPQVALTDTISVSQDLALAGAETLQAEDVAALDAASRSRVLLVRVGAALAGAVVMLVGVALFLASRPNVVVEEPVAEVGVAEARAAARQRRAAPVTPVSPVEDDLAPLLRVTPRKVAAPVRAAPKPAAEAVAPAPAPVEAAAPVAAEAPVVEALESAPVASDFDFLEGAPAPRAELKRPEF